MAEPSFAFVRSSRLWLIILVVGAVVWLSSALVVALTEDTILVPTLLIVGSFFVPVAMVAFAMSRPSEGGLTGDALALGFFGGGTIGLMCAALTEVELLPTVVGTFVSVGLIEETAKGIVLVAVAHGVRSRGSRDGMVLGATVGAGFAAFESTGYALQAMIDTTQDREVVNVVGTEAGRALLAPFGHILWTALLGGALFASASATGAFRLTWRVLGTFAGIVALHAAWDASYGWSIVAANGLVGSGWHLEWPNTAAWAGTPTGSDLVAFDAAYCVLIALNAGLGTAWAVHRYRAGAPVRA